MTDTDPACPGEEPSLGPDPTVLLLVDHERNSRLLARRLSAEYTVVEDPTDGIAETAFDVCILDGRSFERHHESLAAEKRRSEPAFLPYVLLRDEGRDRPPDAVWGLVDEVLTTPLETAELTHRLANLVERRRLSLALQRHTERTERRFETLFDTVPDPIVVTASDGVIAEVNDSFAATVGESPAALVGRSITDLGFDPTENVERVLLQARDPEQDERIDSRTVRLEGDGRPSLITELNANEVSALGEQNERIGIFRDVTERTARESELREQNKRLKQFASTIAHDLRNPLSVAKSNLELAAADDDAASEHLEAIGRAHDRMEQLIDEILTLARQGQVVMDPEPVSIRDATARAWQTVDTRGATLSVDTDDVILADPGRLGECFENLFANAVEHGGRSVSVRVGSIDAGGERGVFVEDDGQGIPEQKRDDVLEAGFTTAEEGTGFGLSIVRQIAEGHDWNLTVADTDGGGARFEITGVTIASAGGDAR